MENKQLTLGSLFDGSGGFPLGGLLTGQITPVWSSEIEPFAIRVTTKRLPQVKHYGDVSAISGADLPPVDIITFGSPCQDMSIAGKRDGLDGSRSSLFYEAIRIVKEMRCKTNGEKPRFIVWENVPGAFSSNKGQDFKAVLEAVIGVKEPSASVPAPEKKGWPDADYYVGDGWSVAYRVFDAQWWGVPQRRKRIYLVADFADQSAPKVLFESEGVSRYSAEGFRAWQRAAAGAESSTGETGCSGAGGRLCLNDQGGERMDVTEEVTATLRAEAHHPPCVMFENHSQDTRYIGPLEVSQTVLATFGTGGNNQPFVVYTPKTLKIRCGCDSGGKGALIQENKSATLSCNNDQTLFEPKAYGICSNDSNSMKSDNPNSGIYAADTSRTIDCGGVNPSSNQGGMAVVALQGSIIGRKEKSGPNGSGFNQDTSFTLNTVDRHAVAYGIDRAAFNQGQNALYDFAIEKEKQPTMVSKGPGAVAEPAYSASKASFFTSAEKECANTLVASDYKDPPLVNDTNGTEYIVRRLTPKECALLQGFPVWWCDGLETENPTEEEIQKWSDIFENHRKALCKSTKPKTRNQIIKWLKNPHSDSAEYTMWGNGVALPCVFYVLNGIAHYAELTNSVI